MTNSEKFCLNWSDFQKNITTSINDFKGEFCDVTLVSEDNTKIQAHKVILAASSNFFRDILRQNPHPNPLLYMRGIKDDQLSAVVDFMYNGKANVAQDDLEVFLQLTAELQLKGLSSTEPEPDKDLKNIQNVKTRKKSNLIQIPFNPKIEPNQDNKTDYHIRDVIDQTLVKEKNDMGENRDLVACDGGTEARISTTDEQLSETIKSMLEKIDGIWSCTQCGKKNKDKSNMNKHIEAKHIDGVSHSCDQCEKQFRSKSSLYNHNNSIHRKQSF